MTILDIDYALGGSINGVNLDITGKGKADFSTGIYEMEMAIPSVPMHWDPALIILICCELRMGVVAEERGSARNIFSLSSGNPILPYRHAAIFDSSGRACGTVVASSHGHVDGSRMISRSQILSGHMHLALNEEIINIETPYKASMLQTSIGMTVVTAAYSFSTNQGNSYTGYTVYPYKTFLEKSNVGIHGITVEYVSMSRTAIQGKGIHFHFKSKSVLDPLNSVTVINP